MSSAKLPTRNTLASQQASEQHPSIKNQQVADFLRGQPDFFRAHPEVLANMSLPHGSGSAVSLVERQVAILRERSMQTRHKLSELLDIAKDNDELFRKTQILVVALMKARSVAELISVTCEQFSAQFFVEVTNILVVAKTPATLAAKIDGAHLRSEALAAEHISSVLSAGETLCGVLRDGEAEFIFGASAAIGSAAIASRALHTNANESEVVNQGDATLLLAVAHQDGDHYNNSTGTLFIDHIADILQIMCGQLLRRA